LGSDKMKRYYSEEGCPYEEKEGKISLGTGACDYYPELTGDDLLNMLLVLGCPVSPSQRRYFMKDWATGSEQHGF